MLPALALAIPAAISAGQMIAGQSKINKANNMPMETPPYYNLFRQDMERRRRLAENGNMMGGTLDAIRNVMGYGSQAVLKGGNVGAANFATRRSAGALNDMLSNMQKQGQVYTNMGYQAGDQAAKMDYQNQVYRKSQSMLQGQELIRAGLQNAMGTAMQAIPVAGVPNTNEVYYPGQTGYAPTTDNGQTPFMSAMTPAQPAQTNSINPFENAPQRIPSLRPNLAGQVNWTPAYLNYIKPRNSKI